ncbi:MAG: metallophosphoesterase family protein [Kiritimatiellae bacterium]|nr:metallophosphoesterase family protein [Kiritimatiellia bacterium]
MHAYPPALERVLEDAEAQRADMKVCLGDVVGYGPDPAGAVALCREACDVVVAGNHDAAVSGRIDSRAFNPRARQAVDWHRDMLSEADIEWLAELPMSDVREDFISVHGEVHRRDGRLAAGFGYVIEAFGASRMFMALPVAIGLVFAGHTHVTDVWSLGGRMAARDFARKPGERYIVNVGAVGYPRFQRETTYVIYDSDCGRVDFRRIPFDFADYARAMEGQGAEPPLWVAGRIAQAAGGHRR